MKTILLGTFLCMSAHAVPAIKCESKNIKLSIVQSAKKEIYVTYGLETVLADGLMTENEVDLIAKFPQSGEMTLIAKVGKTAKESYLYFLGRRDPVTCK